MSSEESTPGHLAVKEMDNIHSVLEVFKKPCGLPKKRKKQIILSEESYVEEIAKIIQRDFFPALEKLKAQNDYLDALGRNDVMRLRELYSKYSGKKPPPMRAPSPATFETPANIHNSQHIPTVEENISSLTETSSSCGPRLSLDQFFNNHTSEDNQAFVETLEDAEKKHKQKYAYLYKEESNSELEQKKLLELPSIEEQMTISEKKFNVDTWGYKNRNYIMFVPDGVELTDEKIKEINEKKLKINYNNTRLQVNPFDDNHSKETIQEMAKAQAKALNGRIGVDGKELIQESPKMGNYSFIRDPSPCPEAMASPLMTWGMIEGTPFRLDGGDTPLPRTPGPSFKMSEPPRREQIAIQLAEKAVERDKDKRKIAMDAAKRLASPSPRVYSPLDRLATMSPAAKRLATSGLKIGLSSPFRSPKTGSVSPFIRNRTPKTAPQRIITPKIKNTSRNIVDGEDLTNDLLKIQVPKRLSASDFF